MELKEYLSTQILELDGNSAGNTGGQVTREEAIKYIKENHYTLSEDNVFYTMKKLSKERETSNDYESEKNRLDALDQETIVDEYNSKICKLVQMPKDGVNPGILLEEDELVIFSCYSFLKLDPRAYENIDPKKKEIIKGGLMGRIYVTETRMLLNCIESVYPVVSTISVEKKNISSVAIAGVYNDEIEIVLNSGQKITFSVPGVDAVDTFKYLYQYIK